MPTDDHIYAHIPPTSVTVGTMVALLREYPPDAVMKVFSTSQHGPEFDDPVLIVVPGAVYVCQATDAPAVSAILSERDMT